ncbi:PGPGW domain-containing protein [Ornithinicoccus halotolerans]|uniref:PGPGW domain-containing protein n=1 Tax=Ornithinicoccus halotolerans TaxID=1748220 RepID=UPI001885D0FB|nr:PGPGW domain-containing protein [Ornithinicoccus halotolerans]
MGVRDRLAGEVWHTIRKTVGWLLVAAGIAGLVLPGPGLLPLVAGLAVLARHYRWAQRLLTPVRHAAWRAAAEGVLSPWRLTGSLLSTCAMATLGVVWVLQPPVAGWWPLPASWWLPGGWLVGAGLLLSAAFALALLAYSWHAVQLARRGGPPVPGVRIEPEVGPAGHRDRDPG